MKKKKEETATMLAQMVAIAGVAIPQKPKKIRPIPVKCGNLNKICSGCGHKNKKCTCNNR